MLLFGFYQLLLQKCPVKFEWSIKKMKINADQVRWNVLYEQKHGVTVFINVHKSVAKCDVREEHISGCYIYAQTFFHCLFLLISDTPHYLIDIDFSDRPLNLCCPFAE